MVEKESIKMDKQGLEPIESDLDQGIPAVKMQSAEEESTGEKKLKIKRRRVDSLDIYEVTEDELQTIERGSPNSTFFSIGVFSISIAISFLLVLLTVDLSAKRAFFDVFVIVTAIGFVAGGVLMVLWFRTKNEVKEAIRRIRDRPAD